jgi:hypothetical protein
MKKLFILLISSLLVSIAGFSQDEVKKVDKPVSEPFFGGYLIDAQTTMIQPEKTLGFVIQHKFGAIENGSEDIWGIYSSANVRLGLDYVVYKNVQVGWGLTRTDLTHDFNVKWTILEQTRKNTIPVAVGFYGNIGLSQQDKELYGAEYVFTDRMSYFGQLIVGRKLADWASVQVGASFTHFNHANRDLYDFDRIGLHANGRFKITGTGSIVFNYDQPLKALQLTRDEQPDINPNVSLGWDISTATHAFQIYLGYSKEILPQYYMMREGKEFQFDQFCVGFTITRMWN